MGTAFSDEERRGDVEFKDLKYSEVLKAVKSGNKRAKTKLAWLKLSGFGGADVDEDGAVTLLQERVKEGDGDAMWMLGVCYEYGRGIEQDIERAEILYKQSSESGNEIGMFFESHGKDEIGSGKMKMEGGLYIT